MRIPASIRSTAFLALLASSALAGQLVFLNGDRIPGSIEGMDGSGFLMWKFPASETPVRLPLATVHKVLLGDTDEAPAVDHNLAVNLTNGDSLHGHLIGLTQDTIDLESVVFGKLRVPRPMITAMTVIDGGYYLLAGPGKPKDWWKNESGTWRVENNLMVARGGGTISRALVPKDKPVPERIRIDFDYTAEDNGSGLTIHFFCANEKNPNEDSNYTIQLAGTYLFARKSVSKREGGKGIFGVQRISLQTEQLGEPTQVERRLGPGGTHLTVLADARTGYINLKIDGQSVKVWNDPQGLGGKHGSAIGFSSNSGGTTTISNLKVTVWNGSDEENAPEIARDKDVIFTRNDDFFKGKVVSLSDKSLNINADDFGTIVVPTDRILRIQLGSEDVDQARRMAGDVKVVFRNGGQLTLQLRSLDKEALAGFSENCGETKLSSSHIREIEFNLYAEKYPAPDSVRGGDPESLLEGGW